MRGSKEGAVKMLRCGGGEFVEEARKGGGGGEEEEEEEEEDDDDARSTVENRTPPEDVVCPCIPEIALLPCLSEPPFVSDDDDDDANCAFPPRSARSSALSLRAAATGLSDGWR